ncbi:MAG TPA: SMP-30/gluconolactonase/LRE family protein [Janthinobacterium sp.]|nr:SMP-30/gluconolactonase/LRE family protein [Janthinobacterium sp.]
MKACMDQSELDLLHDGQNSLGEGVLWCERSQQVYWTDIHAARLHACHPGSGAHGEWTMPERLCCFALTADENVLLLGLESGLAFFNLQTRVLLPICDVEADLPTTRINDGRCDRQGRFVFGTLDEAPRRQAIGSFYRLNHDLTLERLPLPKVAISNSICFSPDGGAMYFCDSVVKTIYRWDAYASGDASAISVFTDLAGGQASPDGSTVDADGHLWNAQWGAARVVRYTPAGQAECMLHLPVSQPSCICLGGADLNDLFVTTAQESLSPDMLAGEPLAGGLFHTRLDGVRGLPEVRFGAAPPAAVATVIATR